MRNIDLVIFRICDDTENPVSDQGFVSFPVVDGGLVNQPFFFDLPEDDESRNIPPNKMILAVSTEDGSEWHHIIDIADRDTQNPANLSLLTFDEIKTIAEHVIQMCQTNSRTIH